MFSLIITIISIALVAALALATIYYGGSAFNKSAAESNATKLLNQAQQLLAADRLYRVDHGSAPTSMADLVNGGYLKSVPTAMSKPIVSTAYASTQEWNMISTTAGTAYSLSSSSFVDEDSCKFLNKKSLGQDGVLKEVYSGYQTQCYGPSVNSLSVLVVVDPLTPVTDSASLPNVPVIKTGTTVAQESWLVEPGSSSNPTDPGNSGGDNSGVPPGLNVPSGLTYTGDPLPAELSSDYPEFYISFQRSGTTPFNITSVAGTVAGGTFSLVEAPFCGVTDGNYYCGAYVQITGATAIDGQLHSGTMTVATSAGNATIPVDYFAIEVLPAQTIKFTTDYLANAQLKVNNETLSYDGNGNEVCTIDIVTVPGSNLLRGDSHGGCITVPDTHVTDFIYVDGSGSGATTFNIGPVEITTFEGYTYTIASPDYNCPGVYLPQDPNAVQSSPGVFSGPFINKPGCSITLNGVGTGGPFTAKYSISVNGGPVQVITKVRSYIVNEATY